MMVLLIMAFFAVCIAYVWWCDRIIGPDPVDLTDEDERDLAFVSPMPPVAGEIGDTNPRAARRGG
jgi:hypothetical protein